MFTIKKALYSQLHSILYMGQQEVYDFLRNNNNKWWTCKEISNLMDISIGSLTNNLKKLRTSKDISYKLSETRTNAYLYRYDK